MHVFISVVISRKFCLSNNRMKYRNPKLFVNLWSIKRLWLYGMVPEIISPISKLKPITTSRNDIRLVSFPLLIIRMPIFFRVHYIGLVTWIQNERWHFELHDYFKWMGFALLQCLIGTYIWCLTIIISIVLATYCWLMTLQYFLGIICNQECSLFLLIKLIKTVFFLHWWIVFRLL